MRDRPGRHRLLSGRSINAIAGYLSITSLDAFHPSEYAQPPMIRLRKVTYSYPDAPPALDDISVSLRRGEHVAVMGPNGSGKTTLARCLNGLLIPQQGTVEVEGMLTARTDQLYPLRATVGMVFQSPDDQLVATSVETEIAFGLENLGVPRPAMHERVEAALREFGLEAYRRHPPHQLSGGEKQRVAVAAAMVLRPAYLVLDEPTALLDPESKQRVLALLRTLPRRYGTALIHITQSPDEAATASRLIVMHRGRIRVDAPPEAVFADPGALEEIGLGVPFAVALRQAMEKRGVRLPANGLDGESATPTAAYLEAARRTPARPPPPRRPLPSEMKVRAEDLVYWYDRGLPTEQPGLLGVSLDVPRGTVIGLLGVSGSGKTTLAQHLNGLITPEQGRVLLDGMDIRLQPLPRVRQRVGLVFQFPERQLFAETVAADVSFGPRNLGWADERVAAAVERALLAVGLPLARFGNRPPLALSGGERRRAALAGVLAMDPEVLVLDEPTAGLDPGSSKAVLDIFIRLVETGKSLVLITHDMELVAELTDRVVVLAGGRVIMSGETRAVLSHPEFATRSGLELPAALSTALQLFGRDAAEMLAPLTLDELAADLARIRGGTSAGPGAISGGMS